MGRNLSFISRLLIGFLILCSLSSCFPILQSQTPAPAIIITPSPSPKQTPTPDSEQLSSGVKHLITYVEELAAREKFSGAILIAKRNEVLYEFAAGMADRDRNIPNQIDTKFNLGSMNKMFTAVAIMQLIEQGKLDLDNTITDCIPDYPNPDVGDQITIHHLLTHTSGLGDTFTETFNANPNQYRTNADFLPLFVNDDLLFDPGQQFSYSNAGYVVLGLIIEVVSGQSYYDYVRLNIFQPAGMINTDSYYIEDDIPNIAIGYTTLDIEMNETGVLARNSALMPGRGFAAGGGFSTVEDLFSFRQALLEHQYLSETATDLLIRGKVEVRENIQYAYGFFDRMENGQRVIGHTGGAPGVCSFINIYLESKYTVIVLTNSDNDCGEVLAFLGMNPLQ